MATNEKTSKKSIVLEYAKSLLIALVLALFVRTFFVQAYKIPSGSMLETLKIGDHILVEKFLFGTHIPFTDIVVLPIKQPKRGDVVVFRYPLDPNLDFIKRIIALPGDTVQGVNKDIYVNGKRLKEPYIQHIDNFVLPAYISPRDNFGPLRIPKDSYFAMGDNRDNSKDSRFWGFVPRHNIKGKAMVIYFSWDSTAHNVRLSRIGNIVH
ncbi:MAG: signal peptidase I [Nitrospirota bacterium]|nr:signal peptidase I [Nitrospirota bacterium]